MAQTHAEPIAAPGPSGGLVNAVGRRVRTRVAKTRYLDALRAGNTRSAAAAVAGVHRATTWRWAEQSVAFTKEVELAESEAVERMEAAFYRAAITGSWRAMLAWLERRVPEKWGPQAALKIELTDERRAAAELIERLQTMTLAEKEAELLELRSLTE